MTKNLFSLLAVLVLASCLTGCNPVTRHKVLSTIFDGVPSLPPPEQLCNDYAEKRLSSYRDELSGKAAAAKAAVITSVHPPYEEKKCDDCHDKGQESGFKRPLKELCSLCHTGFLKQHFVHGPAAVEDCLFCHLPHNASQPALLKKDKSETCSGCHREQRVAARLHETAAKRELHCTDCHSPHDGEIQFFLR